jgi:hypothetical protein
MAKIEDKPGEVYATKNFSKNVTAAAKVAAGTTMKDPNTLPANKMTIETAVPRVSAGDLARADTKTTGIETRGNGAATKGRIARGPMA